MNVEPTMTDDEHETDVCIARLAALFSQCRAAPNYGAMAHCWNFTKRECDYCKAPFPYPEAP